jgi:hypothetical protein
MGTFNDWINGNNQRAIKFAEIIPAGTPVRSVFYPANHAPDGEDYTPFEGYFSGLDLEYPFPIYSVNPDANTQRYSDGHDLLVFWQDRWQTVYEIVGEVDEDSQDSLI